MQKLFGFYEEGSQGVVTIPEWEYLRLEMSRSLKTVISYYRRFAYRVDGSHFLIKLLYAAGVNRNQPLDRFYSYVSAKAMNVSMALKMTSPIYKGQLFNGVFYGGDTKEILIAHDDYFDYEQAAKNWEELEPIKVLYHPKSDLGFNIPDGESYSEEDGIAVIAINIPMLVIQYREFMLREDLKTANTGESPKGVTHFIYSYPLTNMLRSHLDVAIFNRLYNALFDIPCCESNKKHSFYVTDSTRRLNQVQAKQLDILRKSTKRFDVMMKSIPLISCEDMSKLVELPDVAPTRQVIWGLILSRMKMLSFLFNAGLVDPRITNAKEVNKVVRTLQNCKSDAVFKSSLPYDQYFDFKGDLTKIVDPRKINSVV